MSTPCWRLASALVAAASLAACSSNNPQADASDAGADAASDAIDVPSMDLVSAPCDYDGGAEPRPAEPAPHTPRWVFEPWISKDISSTDDTYAFVQGFRDRDIPVGVVVLDSPWETQYHTFVPHASRYHDFDRLVRDLHAQDIRLVLWITMQVNRSSYDLEPGADTYTNPSPNFVQGQRCGFFVQNGRVYPWWKGQGSGIDFFNPRALGWWHRQQDPLLALGVDGWKLDFGENYLRDDPLTTAMGPVAHQAYSEEYYRDFLAYGVAQRGREFATLVRAWDRSYEFDWRSFARPEHAPAAWMGDNRRDWVGLADALESEFRSAQAGYVVVGSDIGGYLDVDDQNLLGPQIPFSQTNFVRWVAVGALSPFMQLHGRANLTPWTVSERPDETVLIYRYWATLHHELVPFFYSLAQSAYAGGQPYRPILRPVAGDMSQWAGDYRYHLGDALLVAPVLEDTGVRDVALPAGADYYDWWAPAADPVAGGTMLRAYDSSDRARVPLFVRAGAIIPAEVSSGLTGLGSMGSRGALTVLVYPGSAASAFTVSEADDTRVQIDARPGTNGTDVTLTGLARTAILRVRADVPIRAASVGGAALSPAAARAAFDAGAGDFYMDGALRAAWVRVRAPAGGAAVTVSLAR